MAASSSTIKIQAALLLLSVMVSLSSKNKSKELQLYNDRRISQPKNKPSSIAEGLLFSY